MHSLDASPYAWLHQLLKAFNAGDMHGYDALCVKYAAQLNSQPALVSASSAGNEAAPPGNAHCKHLGRRGARVRGLIVLSHAWAARLQVANERRLREKITLMSLMEMISSLPAEERNIALAAIAQRTKLDVDGVEFLLMKVCGRDGDGLQGEGRLGVLSEPKACLACFYAMRLSALTCTRCRRCRCI